jgi:hypothetical protein
MKRAASTVAAAAAVGLLLAGCAPQPSADEIEERFAIEIAGIYDRDKDDDTVREFAEIMSDGATDNCKDPTYWRLMKNNPDWEPDMLYVQAASCSVLYGDSIPESLHEEYKQVVLDHVAESVTE